MPFKHVSPVVKCLEHTTSRSIGRLGFLILSGSKMDMCTQDGKKSRKKSKSEVELGNQVPGGI